MKKIPLSKPSLGPEEERAVIQVLRSGQLAQGESVKLFEKRFADYIGVKHAIATANGTVALHLALLALGIKEGDEVITTSFSFISSANCILFTGAKPVFVDIDPETFNIDPDLIEKKITKRTKAILPVHLFGLTANMNRVAEIANKYGLSIVEDACQAHGAEIYGKKAGSLGIAGCFSFYPTKNMTTGEGGMVTTNDPLLANKIRLLRNHGMSVRYHHDTLGYNFRLTDIAAAIGVEQLKKLAKFNEKRIKNAAYLNKYLGQIKGLKIPQTPINYRHVFHQYTIKITDDYKLSREDLLQKLDNSNIGYMIYYPIPIHKQKIYLNGEVHNKLPVTEMVAGQVLSLPVHPQVTKEDLSRIVTILR